MSTRTTLLAALVSMVLLGGCEAIVLRFGEGSSGTTGGGGGGETTTAGTAGMGGTGGVGGTGAMGGTGGMGGAGGTVPQCDPGGGEPCPALSVAWSVRRGEAAKRQSGTGLAVTSNGEMIVGGTYDGQIDFGPCDEGTGLLPQSANRGVFFAKLHPDGQCIWARAFDAEVYTLGVAADAEGSVLAAGVALGSYDFQGGLPLGAPNHDQSLFLLKLSAEGAHVWSASITSDDADLDVNPHVIGRWVSVDPKGPDTRVFVVGEHRKADGALWMTHAEGTTMLPLPPAIGVKDTFVLALEPAQGKVLWGKALGAPGASFTVQSALVRDGELAFAGRFQSESMLAPVTVGGCVLPYQLNDDVFAAGLSIGGPLPGETLSWCVAIGGEGLDKADAIARNDQGEIFLSGALNGAVVAGECASPGGQSLTDAFVAKLDPTTHALAFLHRFEGGDDPNDVRTSLATTGQGCVAFAALTRPQTDAGLEGRMLLREISRAGAIRDLGDLVLEGPLTSLRFRREVGIDAAGNMIVFGSFANQLNLGPPGQPPLSTGTADVDDTDLFLAKLVPSP